MYWCISCKMCKWNILSYLLSQFQEHRQMRSWFHLYLEQHNHKEPKSHKTHISGELGDEMPRQTLHLGSEGLGFGFGFGLLPPGTGRWVLCCDFLLWILHEMTISFNSQTKTMVKYGIPRSTGIGRVHEIQILRTVICARSSSTSHLASLG